MHVQKAKSAAVKFEYGCDLRRLYPWKGVADPAWGSVIASVRPGEATTPHAHDESETFIVLSGRGRIEVGAENEELEIGDVVLIPKNSQHQFHNLSEHEPLVFISIFWDSPEAREKTHARLAQGAHDL
jgi:mannose-6-phosphate isomerase-like protein (cupin superfamily)